MSEYLDVKGGFDVGKSTPYASYFGRFSFARRLHRDEVDCGRRFFKR